MMTRHTVLRTALAAGLVALVAAGCSHTPMQKMDNYTATLTGAQEVPPKTTAGTGNAEVHYNSATGKVSYRVTYSGLSGPLTGAHIHGPAAAGANAGVLIPFTNGPSPLTGEATITPTQFGDLAAGLWYVNLHTAANPGGEIRGQLTRRP